MEFKHYDHLSDIVLVPLFCQSSSDLSGTDSIPWRSAVVSGSKMPPRIGFVCTANPIDRNWIEIWGGQVSASNSLLCFSNISWTIFALGQGALATATDIREYHFYKKVTRSITRLRWLACVKGPEVSSWRIPERPHCLGRFASSHSAFWYQHFPR